MAARLLTDVGKLGGTVLKGKQRFHFSPCESGDRYMKRYCRNQKYGIWVCKTGFPNPGRAYTLLAQKYPNLSILSKWLTFMLSGDNNNKKNLTSIHLGLDRWLHG